MDGTGLRTLPQHLKSTLDGVCILQELLRMDEITLLAHTALRPACALSQAMVFRLHLALNE